MLKVTFVRLPEEGVEKLKDWLGSLDARREELAASYRRQHTRQELFYLMEGQRGPVLVIVSDSANLEEGAREFLNSEHAIDREFKQLIQEAGTIDPDVELVYDSLDFVQPPPLRSTQDADPTDQD